MKSINRIASVWIVLLLAGCASPTAQAPQPTQDVAVVVAETIQALTAVAPVEQGTTITFQNISFTIPEGLAENATGEVTPTSGEDAPPWEMAPEHVFFTFSGYAVADDEQAVRPKFIVFPAQGYEELNPGGSISLPKLRALLASPSMPINVESAPAVPFFNAGQILVAQGKLVQFESGNGVRMISHYTQFPSPITQTGQAYHFQGLTSDGKYYVVAVFPIHSPLQSTADNPSADGIVFPDFASAAPGEMDAYYLAITDKLNAADPASFSPSLAQLDALIQSIQITP